MKLYISAASSFSRKVRVLLLEKRVPHEIEVVNLWEPNELQRTNPIGKVPTLVLDDGRVLISSALIADWIDERFPQPRFVPPDADARLEVRRWEAIADGVMDAVAASSYEIRFHDENCRSGAWLQRQRGKVDAGLTALEAQLRNGRWLCGEAVSLADIAVACHLGFVTARMPQLFDAASHPGLARLARELGARESFVTTAPPPGIAGDAGPGIADDRERACAPACCPSGGDHGAGPLPSGSMTEPDLPCPKSSVAIRSNAKAWRRVAPTNLIDVRGAGKVHGDLAWTSGWRRRSCNGGPPDRYSSPAVMAGDAAPRLLRGENPRADRSRS